MNRFYLGVCLILLSSVGFGVIPIFAKYAYQGGANVATILFVRFAVASLIFFLYLWWRRRLRVSLTKKQWASLFVFGGVVYALISTWYFEALHYISGSLATLLLYTYPLFVVVLSIWWEKSGFSKSTLSAILLSLLGLAVVLGTNYGEIHYYGVFLAMIASVGYAVHIVLMNRMVKAMPPLLTSAFMMLFTTVTLFVIALWTGTLDFQFNGVAWLSIIGLSFASTILSLLTFFVGLEMVGSTNASILSMMEPLITIVLSVLILGETFTGVQMIGAVVVIAGAVIVVRSQGRSQGKVEINHSA
ncbi:DMT family transporter [Tumebacillus sp. DT12]|uniref:DMT family transporter n=1 Tax=Tumebacillus lacus TaxID=2995335 RepID=A0ABT3X852_9BACL|nr:DMT family transporter [Tumebacillus lacus]MCX7570934.1 DMT family transporter [Tumebacillus lacus]